MHTQVRWIYMQDLYLPKKYCTIQKYLTINFIGEKYLSGKNFDNLKCCRFSLTFPSDKECNKVTMHNQ